MAHRADLHVVILGAAVSPFLWAEECLGAYFRREDPGEVLFREWSAGQNQSLQFSNNDTWDRMLEQGIMLLIRFCQDNRIQIEQANRNLQIKFTGRLERTNSSPTLMQLEYWTERTVCWKTS